MTTTGDPATRYVLDGSDADLQRLLDIAAVQSAMTWRLLQQVPAESGWRALDCGCGPIGAMALLADMVGPTGHVVGMDFNPSTAERARSVAAAMGLANVDVVVGDINDGGCPLDGPFDLVFTRCFLMHQPDIVHTLGRIAALLRPGGWLVALEPMQRPVPRAHPELPALGAYWDVMYDAVMALGVPPHTTENLPAAARAVGLEPAYCDCVAEPMAPEVVLPVHAMTAAAAKERAVATGVATAEAVDELVTTLQAAATNGAHAWVTTPFYLAMTLQKTG